MRSEAEGQASVTSSAPWWTMTAAGTEASERLADALLAYCKLDSYAMYAIWRKLQQRVEGT
jgi:hypothetical protein